MIDIVIVGGGIAGLSAAWELAGRGNRPLVLEQGARAGGVIFTETIDGFVIDAGPDALLVQKPAAIDLCRELGLATGSSPPSRPAPPSSSGTNASCRSPRPRSSDFRRDWDLS